MKRVILPIAVVVVLAAASAVIIFLMKDKKYDVEMPSRDGETKLLFQEAATEEPERVGMYAYRFTVEDTSEFYTKFIENNSDVVYSVDDNNNQTTGETGRYLFCIDQHYYYIKPWEIPNTYKYTELVFFVAGNGDGECVVPIISAQELYDTDFFSWEDTAGIHSFEELKEFYSRIRSDRYEIDEETKTIYLSKYIAAKWVPHRIALHVTEDGFKLESVEESGR